MSEAMGSTNADMPLATFAVFVYRHEQFVAEALAGAFAQDYRPLEIIVVDDGSPDGSAAEIERVLATYTGPIPVRFIRNVKNAGLMPTLNRVMAESKGEIILFGAGDDVSVPSRTSETVKAFLEDDTIYSLYTNAVVIDSEGRELRSFYPVSPGPERHDIAYAAREGFAILGASHAWRRRVFDVFGPIPEGVAFEDHAIPFRAGFMGRIAYLEQKLVRYRQHGANMFLGATTTDDGVSEWYKGMHRYASQERANLIGRLADLETARRVFRHRADEIERLRQVTQREIEQKDAQLRLLAGPPLLTRLGIIVGEALKGMQGRRLARWILIFLFPRMYLRRLRRRAV